MMLLSLGNIILLKEKERMRESSPRQVDKKSRGPQGGRKDKPFFSSTFLRII